MVPSPSARAERKLGHLPLSPCALHTAQACRSAAVFCHLIALPECFLSCCLASTTAIPIPIRQRQKKIPGCTLLLTPSILLWASLPFFRGKQENWYMRLLYIRCCHLPEEFSLSLFPCGRLVNRQHLPKNRRDNRQDQPALT